MASVVFSYSHQDEALRDELEAHLAGLRREGLITTWHDRRIVPGQPLDKTISVHFENADVILLLVSSDFINSDYCHEIEVRRAMERHERAEAVVIPVILRPCDWHHMPFGTLLASPKDGRAVTSWSNRDEAFHEVARVVRAAIEHLRRRRAEAPEAPGGRRQPPSAPRSSHISFPRTFSEKAKDDFLEEAFNYIADFFEDSLAELERQNADVETGFRRLDAALYGCRLPRRQGNLALHDLAGGPRQFRRRDRLCRKRLRGHQQLQ